MTKSKAKGGKNRRKCKRSNYTSDEKVLEFKEVNQDYAKVLERKGGPIVTLKLYENRNEVLGVIRGKMRKRVWLSSGNIVLVSLREFQSEKVDIIHKYKDEHVRKLINLGELDTDFVNDTKSFLDGGNDVNIEFVDVDFDLI